MCDCPSVITAAEQIRLWLSALLGPLATAAGFAFIYRQVQIAAAQASIASNSYVLSAKAAERAAVQAAEQQNWKKAEFLAKEVKEFFGDETVKKVTYMLDWHVRKIQLAPKSDETVLSLHDETSCSAVESLSATYREFSSRNKVVVLAQALRKHDSEKPFTELEMLVRDDFDWFFFRLGQFQHMIQSGLFSYGEVDVHLSYVLDLVSGGLNHVSPKLTEAMAEYVRAYDFPAVVALAHSRADFRKAKKESGGSSAETILPIK